MNLCYDSCSCLVLLLGMFLPQHQPSLGLDDFVWGESDG